MQPTGWMQLFTEVVGGWLASAPITSKAAMDVERKYAALETPCRKAAVLVFGFLVPSSSSLWPGPPPFF
jgi:hypothetical protein